MIKTPNVSQCTVYIANLCWVKVWQVEMSPKIVESAQTLAWHHKMASALFQPWLAAIPTRRTTTGSHGDVEAGGQRWMDQ